MASLSSSFRAARFWLTVVALSGVASVSFSAPRVHAEARNTLSVSHLDDVLDCTRTDLWVSSLRIEQSLSGQLGYKLRDVRRDLVSPVFRTVSQRFAAPTMGARFRDILAVRVESHKLEKVLAFYRTPLGHRYAQADQQVRVDDARAFLAEHPLSNHRRAALERWVDASKAMDRFVTVVVQPAAMLQRSLSAFDAKKGRGPSEKDLLAPMHSKELRASVIEHAARTLHGFSDEELATLTRFERSHESEAYRDGELDALRQVLEEAFAALTIELEAAGKRVPRGSAPRTLAGR